MKTSQNIEAAANLKGMAKHTYNSVMSAMAEDTTAAMLHTFAALTDGAKAIALQSGKFSNLYIRGEHKGMAAEEAAKELAERAAGCVTRKLRKIDMVCAASFLAEYISRQRKAIETPETPNPELNNTPATMNANETIVTVSVTDNGNKCEYTADGKVLAAITYRKEFDAYDVNTPTVGYMTADVTEAHKACENGKAFGCWDTMRPLIIQRSRSTTPNTMPQYETDPKSHGGNNRHSCRRAALLVHRN